MTAEDPVEYMLQGVNQVQCKPDIGLTFAAALRSFLRQDPDVIMVGEIRDFETAEIAIKASMTATWFFLLSTQTMLRVQLVVSLTWELSLSWLQLQLLLFRHNVW